MKDKNRDQVAYELFKIMNLEKLVALRTVPPRPDEEIMSSYWDWMVQEGFHKGYLRIADEIVKKGYKP